MTRRLLPEFETCPDAQLVARWEALLSRAPRLRPWLCDMLSQRRELGSAEDALWSEAERWLRDFEALPQFAVSAIATTLEGDPGTQYTTPHRTPPAERDELRNVSPDLRLAQLEALTADPAFALAWHCVQTRIRPRLPGLIAESAWFGLLHATIPQKAALTPEVAVSLVLRVLGAEWSKVPAAQRRAAMRLFGAKPADLRAEHVVQRLCAELPWPVADATAFVHGAEAARKGLSEACALSNRILAATRARRGGLTALEAQGPQASPEELAELQETARNHTEMQGFRRLLALL